MVKLWLGVVLLSLAPTAFARYRKEHTRKEYKSYKATSTLHKILNAIDNGGKVRRLDEYEKLQVLDCLSNGASVTIKNTKTTGRARTIVEHALLYQNDIEWLSLLISKIGTQLPGSIYVTVYLASCYWPELQENLKDIMTLIHRYKPDMNYCNAQSPHTLLGIAVIHKDSDFVRYLVNEFGVEHARDCWGRTPLNLTVDPVMRDILYGY